MKSLKTRLSTLLCCLLMVTLSVWAGSATAQTVAGANSAAMNTHTDANMPVKLPMLTRHLRSVETPTTATMIGRLPDSQKLRLTIALPLRNEQGLDQFLIDVYDPTSPGFRHFMSVKEFTARFGPSQADYNAVLNMFRANGFTITALSKNHVNIEIEGSVANIESTFHVKMQTFQHPYEDRTFYQPDKEPTTDLPFQLWHVSGLDNFSTPRPAGLVSREQATHSNSYGSGPGQEYLGSDMRAAYYGGGNLTGTGQSLGLFEFGGVDTADISTYFSNVGQTDKVPLYLRSTDGSSVNCVYSAGCDDSEAVIDVTQAIGMAPGLSDVVMYIASNNHDSSILNAMATDDTLSYQLSCSWLWSPADPSTDDPYFKEFAAQGQNFFAATGDYGAWPVATKSYYYPAEDAYVTAVGGTVLQTTSTAGPWASETGWSSGGGGISQDGIAISSWQQTAANACSSCSKTLRNVPDVSANAQGFYACTDQNSCSNYVGTSFAAPMWAGYLALANQQSLASRNQVLGFINPALYSAASSGSYTTDFHDIEAGSNGFNSTAGFDLVTGLGTPNSGLINLLAGSASVEQKSGIPYLVSESWSWNGPVHHSEIYHFTVSNGNSNATIHYTIQNTPVGSCYSSTSGTVASGGTITSGVAQGDTCEVVLSMYATTPGYTTSNTTTIEYQGSANSD